MPPFNAISSRFGRLPRWMECEDEPFNVISKRPTEWKKTSFFFNSASKMIFIYFAK